MLVVVVVLGGHHAPFNVEDVLGNAVGGDVQHSPVRDIQSLVVQDLNGDGLGDLISAGETSLTLFLTQKRGGRR